MPLRSDLEKPIDLNADIGEGMADADAALADLITSASIACGGHAGDRASMAAAVRLCIERGLRIGAHPSYPDRQGFGRVSMPMEPAESIVAIVSQVEELQDVAQGLGASVAYIKPHGALYNDAASHSEIAGVVAEASRDLGLPLMCLAGSELVTTAGAIAEGFIDRGYSDGGRLIPRGQPGASITEPDEAAAQALRLAPKVDSLCVHSDTPGAPTLMAAARRALEAAGYVIGA